MYPTCPAYLPPPLSIGARTSPFSATHLSAHNPSCFCPPLSSRPLHCTSFISALPRGGSNSTGATSTITTTAIQGSPDDNNGKSQDGPHATTSTLSSEQLNDAIQLTNSKVLADSSPLANLNSQTLSTKKSSRQPRVTVISSKLKDAATTTSRRPRSSPAALTTESPPKSNNTTAAPTNTPSRNPPPLTLTDSISLWLKNMLVLYGNRPPTDNIPLARGDVTDLLGDSPFFLSLHRYYENTGPVYKLAFGPKSFVVLQDAKAVRHVLKDKSYLYDKGILAEVLEEIMGKGLIPADFVTWKKRRREIVPGLHTAWLKRMTAMFGGCTQNLIEELERKMNAQLGEGQESFVNDYAGGYENGNGNVSGNGKYMAKGDGGREEGVVVDIENQFCSLALDIIGKAVFNYEFGSVNKESPIIAAVYRVLREAEHRSTCFVPYWKIPGARKVVGRQRQFRKDMKLITDTLNTLIRSAQADVDTDESDEEHSGDFAQSAADRSDLISRDRRREEGSEEDHSLLRFFVELRGEEVTNKQLRDDLITLLIAGHETTAAALTWTIFELAQQPKLMERAREEIERVMGHRQFPDVQDIKQMSLMRRILAETLRMYPEPPLLIRRLLSDDTIPTNSDEESMKSLSLTRGTDVFINVYSLHRRDDLWERPNKFDPDRWLRPFKNAGVKDWKGYQPAAGLDDGNPLYPNEQNADFAFLPFGGGSRKCIGDQFAVLESVVALAMMLRKFDFELVDDPKNMEMDTGATIHTRNGLGIRLSRRRAVGGKDGIEVVNGARQELNGDFVLNGATVAVGSSAQSSATPSKAIGRPSDN